MYVCNGKGNGNGNGNDKGACSYYIGSKLHHPKPYSKQVTYINAASEHLTKRKNDKGSLPDKGFYANWPPYVSNSRCINSDKQITKEILQVKGEEEKAKVAEGSRQQKLCSRREHYLHC